MKRAIILFILISSGALYADIQNYEMSTDINFQLISVSLQEDGPEKKDRVFIIGQTVWVNLKVSGIEKDANKDVIFQADLLVTDENGKVLFNNKNILNKKLHAGDIKPFIITTFKIRLVDNINPGQYSVDVTFRDMVAKKYNSYKTWFKVIK